MLVRTIGAFIAMLCGYACYWSARWAIADWAIRSSVEHALRLAPGNPEYYLRLARAKPALALSALRRAADLNPLNSSVWIELAGAAEEHQDFRGAESSLLRAVQLDKTFAPRWLLAEYYSRRHDQTHFWPAVRAALATSYDDVTPLFDMCWELAPEPAIIQQRALPARPDVWRQYFDFLLSKNRLDAAESIAGQLVEHATKDTVPSLLRYCDRLLENNEGSRAVETWNQIGRTAWTPRSRLPANSSSTRRKILCRLCSDTVTGCSRTTKDRAPWKPGIDWPRNICWTIRNSHQAEASV